MTINILYSSHSGSPVVFAAQELARCLAKIVADSIIITNNQNCRSDEVTLRLESLKNPKNSEDAYPSTSPRWEAPSREAMTAVFFSAFTSIYGFSAAVSPLPAGSTNPFLLYIRKNSSPPAVRNRRRCVTGASASRSQFSGKYSDYIDWLPKLGATASFCSSSCPIPLWPAGITTR